MFRKLLNYYKIFSMRGIHIFLFALLIIAIGAGIYIKHIAKSFEVASDGLRGSVARELEFIERTSNSFQSFDRFKKEPYTILFAGDIMLTRGVAGKVERFGEGDYTYPFVYITDVLQSADIAFANLEGPISSRGKNQGSIYSFRMEPKVIAGLTFAGFDVLSVANNHIWDWGSDALEDTLNILEVNNIIPVGAGRNYAEANTAKTVALGNTKIAFLAYTNLMPQSLQAIKDAPGLSEFNFLAITERIKKAKAENDIVVVSLHWGEEYEPYPTASERETAHAFVDAGADLIIGHHSHVVRDVERYVPALDANRVGWIAYSLGNFVFDQNFSEETMRGLLLEATIQNENISNTTIIPVELTATFQPHIRNELRVLSY